MILSCKSRIIFFMTLLLIGTCILRNGNVLRPSPVHEAPVPRPTPISKVCAIVHRQPIPIMPSAHSNPNVALIPSSLPPNVPLRRSHPVPSAPSPIHKLQSDPTIWQHRNDCHLVSLASRLLCSHTLQLDMYPLRREL